MDNQHRLIRGYRELSKSEIEDMNYAKALEARVLESIESHEKFGEADKRWLAIAKTDLQKGFMALGRAIARPDGY